MKNITTLFLLFITTLSFGQIVNIPDANFKAALVSGMNTSTADFVFDPSTNGYQDITPDGILIDTNNDGEIQVSEALNIKGITVPNLNISSLEGIEAFANLEYLKCNENQLTSLDLTANTALELVFCRNNQLQTLDVSTCINLQAITVAVNELTTLDFTNNINLQFAEFVGNDDTLQSINLKNGAEGEALFFAGGPMPNLEFVCADEADLSWLNTVLGNGVTVINTYCSFVPGGNYNTITGTSRFDLNADGCDATDVTFPFLKLNIDDGTETGIAYSNELGIYNFYTQDGNFTVTPDVENPTFFNVTPANAMINFPDDQNNIEIQDFCLTPNGIHNDVEIVVAPIDFARPGFDASYVITIKNKGNQTLSGDFSFAYDETRLDYVSATETPTSQSAGLLSWNYTSLVPFENRSVYVTLNVNAPTDTPAVNIDDELNFTGTINPIAGDELPDDNQFFYKQIVVGSYDPNDITCLQGTTVDPTMIGDYLHYIINFENTGNFFAQNVVLEMAVDNTQFDINTTQLLSSSHNPRVYIEANIIRIIFENINLESGGHGNILLKMQTQDTLFVNDMVSNNANIFFDFNFPITTNNAETTFAVLSTEEFNTNQGIKLYPNPTKDHVYIEAAAVIESVEIYDVQGRVVSKENYKIKNVELNLSNQAKGIYFVKIKTAKGVTTEKIVKM
jgi:hypothetical protein